VPALLIVACMREGELAAGFGINTPTAWRYLTRTVALLAARAPKSSQALAATWDVGHAYPVLDGPLSSYRPGGRRPPSCSGKHRRHGMDEQAVASPVDGIRGSPAPARPSTHSPG
jgi:hypothetical protein